MMKFVRLFLPQRFINIFWHLPKAILANILYGFPTRKLKVIGIIGTDGKTTTTNMIYQILKSAGKKASMVSTINAVVGGKTYDTGFHVTSPDPFLVQKFAKGAVRNGDEYLVLEATSHGLDQFRFWGIKFYAAVITNITHEHLDYHKTFENYFNTKLRVLRDVKYAIVNENLKIKLSKKLLTFGLNKGDFNQRDVELRLKIPGSYNVENALAALASAFVLGIDKGVARKALESFDNLEGRMEEIKNKKGIKVYVDFAHTPNGLEKALTALKEDATGRVIAVFGSAGKRDVGKRFLMGEIAAKMANIIVITAEDPRGELKKISQQIADGARKAGGKDGISIFLIEDRGRAIDFAVNKLAKRGDTIGIFGKGHEKSINIDGKKEIPWSDFEAVQKALF